MKIQEVVISFNKAKNLPQSAFKNSALVWAYAGDGMWRVEVRQILISCVPPEYYPAPTLQEIINDMLDKYYDRESNAWHEIWFCIKDVNDALYWWMDMMDKINKK